MIDDRLRVILSDDALCFLLFLLRRCPRLEYVFGVHVLQLRHEPSDERAVLLDVQSRGFARNRAVDPVEGRTRPNPGETLPIAVVQGTVRIDQELAEDVPSDGPGLIQVAPREKASDRVSTEVVYPAGLAQLPHHRVDVRIACLAFLPSLCQNRVMGPTMELTVLITSL